MFLFLFVFLVLFVSIQKNSFALLCFCVIFVTRLSGLLVCILWSFFLFLFFFFVLNFVFSFLSKKDPQKTGHSKNPKSKNAEKKRTKKIS